MTRHVASYTAQPEAVALFISDLHLCASQVQTTQAFFDFLQRHARRAQQLYLLGDIFEYWAGDDDMSAPYHQQIIDAIRQVSAAGVAVFWMAGNRDFLVGDDFARVIGATRLSDPFIATIAGQRIILLHGDAQCTDDTAYMAFRAQVRQDEWQREFLRMPLMQRKTIIEGLRSDSRQEQRGKSYTIMDVNPAAIEALFLSSGANIMIHGHTHRPARHVDGQHVRYVLPDWECDSTPPRGGWIAITPDGVIKRYGLDGVELL